MVRRILNLLTQEVRGLHEAAYLLGFFTILSQILALLRDRLLAYHFGAGATLDVYYAAFRIPDFIFVSVASLVSLYVLIPFLSEAAYEQPAARREFLSGVFSFFTLSMFGVSAAAFIATPQLLPLLIPGLAHSPYAADLILLTRVLLLQPILLGISNIAASVTQTYGRFVLYALSPVLYNVGIIVGVVFLYPRFGLMGLGLGVVLGALFHLLVQVPFLIREGLFPRPKMFFGPELRRVLVLSFPRTLALSANQIALLILTGLASVMAVGSIAVFNFSYNLQAVPLTVIALSYSVAAFPTLARLFSSGDKPAFFLQVVTAARHIIFWSLPAAVLFIVLRAQIVRVVLGSGHFDWADTRITAAALALFSFSLVAQGLVLLFVRGYYATGNTRTPLLVNVSCSALVIVFGFLFTYIFSHEPLWRYFIESLLRVSDVPGTSLLMLPLSYSLAAMVNVGVFLFLFQRDFKGFSVSISRALFESLSASVVMGFVTYEFLEVFGHLFDINTFWGIFGQGLIGGSIGIGAGVGILFLLGNTEIREVSASLRKKFWKTEAITPESPDLTTSIS